jgi:hypothetical protein
VDLALARSTRAHGAGEPIPGARKRAKIGPSAATVRGEHRAHSAIAIAVGAGDYVVALKPFQHRDSRRMGKGIDHDTQPLCLPALFATHQIPPAPRVCASELRSPRSPDKLRDQARAMHFFIYAETIQERRVSANRNFRARA